MINDKLKPTIRPNTNDIQDPTISAAITPDQYINYPDSPTLSVLTEALSAGTSIETYAERQNTINPNYTHKADIDENRYTYVQYNDKNNAYWIVEMKDPDKINTPVKKTLDLLLIEVNERCFNKGKLTREAFTFPIEDLISLGAYETKDTARREYKKAILQLGDNLKLSARYTSKGKDDLTYINRDESLEVITIFPTLKYLKGGTCYVRINPDINWPELMKTYALLSKYTLSLTDRAYRLSKYIDICARRNIRDLLKKGKISISFKRIQAILGLRDKTENPNRDILEAIEKAIKEIRSAQKKYNSIDKTFTLVYDRNLSVSNIINTGKLVVGFNDIYIEQYESIAENQTKRIAAAITKKKKREG